MLAVPARHGAVGPSTALPPCDMRHSPASRDCRRMCSLLCPVAESGRPGYVHLSCPETFRPRKWGPAPLSTSQLHALQSDHEFPPCSRRLLRAITDSRDASAPPNLFVDYLAAPSRVGRPGGATSRHCSVHRPPPLPTLHARRQECWSSAHRDAPRPCTRRGCRMQRSALPRRPSPPTSSTTFTQRSSPSSVAPAAPQTRRATSWTSWRWQPRRHDDHMSDHIKYIDKSHSRWPNRRPSQRELPPWQAWGGSSQKGLG